MLMTTSFLKIANAINLRLPYLLYEVSMCKSFVCNKCSAIDVTTLESVDQLLQQNQLLKHHQLNITHFKNIIFKHHQVALLLILREQV